MRKCLVGMFGVLLASGIAVAIDPHVEGREPTPIAREFHIPDAPVRSGSGGMEWQKRQGEEQVCAYWLF